MKILSEGISDNQIQKDDFTRFALTAKEIKGKLESSDNPKVRKTSYTNLYFHLKKMIEAGVIQPIAQVIERSHRITYYGRSAHVILLGTPEKEFEQFTKAFTELFQLLKIINTEFPDIQVGDLAEQYIQQKTKRDADYAKWIAKNIEISLVASKLSKLKTVPSPNNKIPTPKRIFPKIGCSGFSVSVIIFPHLHSLIASA